MRTKKCHKFFTFLKMEEVHSELLYFQVPGLKLKVVIETTNDATIYPRVIVPFVYTCGGLNITKQHYQTPTTLKNLATESLHQLLKEKVPYKGGRGFIRVFSLADFHELLKKMKIGMMTEELVTFRRFIRSIIQDRFPNGFNIPDRALLRSFDDVMGARPPVTKFKIKLQTGSQVSAPPAESEFSEPSRESEPSEKPPRKRARDHEEDDSSDSASFEPLAAPEDNSRANSNSNIAEIVDIPAVVKREKLDLHYKTQRGQEMVVRPMSVDDVENIYSEQSIVVLGEANEFASFLQNLKKDKELASMLPRCPFERAKFCLLWLETDKIVKRNN